jgi:hypothetical protein
MCSTQKVQTLRRGTNLPRGLPPGRPPGLPPPGPPGGRPPGGLLAGLASVVIRLDSSLAFRSLMSGYL